jgi:glycosyltransferase involved in cell wall biosynthesis
MHVIAVNILFFSIVPWKFLWSRPQQIVSRLVDRGHNIIFFQNPMYLDPSTLSRNYKENGVFLIKKIRKNLYIINFLLPPFLGKLDFVAKRMGLIIFKLCLKCLHFKPDVAIFYSYPYIFLLHSLKAMHVKTLYDCPDEFSEFSDVNALKVLKVEEEAFRNCSVIIAVSKKLHSKIRKFNSNCFYIPNAADFKHFNRAMQIIEKPFDIINLKRPIIGFIGTIYDWIDVDLICKLARLHPEYSILLVGPIRYGFDRLKKYSNIKLTGSKPYAVLPRYLACMDVCLIPFKINRLTLASNPIKLYEYLAAGKPVVSTALPEVCENASGLVYIAKDSEDFIRKVEKAVKEAESPNRELIMRRIKFAKENSWEKRIETIEKLLQSI